ncbi:MAG: hypothetical protein WCD37_10800 [Chloroflexia bacterium]
MSDNNSITNRASDIVQDVAGDATRMVKEFRKRVNPMDTTSLLLTFGVTVVALILGMFIWNGVVGGTRTYTDATGVRVTLPGNWVSSDSGLINNTAGTIVAKPDVKSNQPFTLFQVERVTVDANAPATTTLGLVANDLATTRGRELNAFRVLESTGFTGSGTNKQPLQIKGLPGYRLEYVFVDTPNNALSGNIPKVIIGEDRLVRKGDKVYVFSVRSTDSDRATVLPWFDNFVETAVLP